MLVFLIFFLIICLYGIKIRPKSGFDDYMSIEKTTCIKGIFICIVFMSHVTGYADFDGALDAPFVRLTAFLGQMMVIPFLFYSGYGVMEAIKKKGKQYIRQLPYRRAFKVLLHFDLALSAFLALSFIADDGYGIRKILLSFVCWDSIGNSNWFIFTTVAMYLFTWLSFTVFRYKTVPSSAGVMLLSAAFVVGLKISGAKESWWYDTAIFYFCGMLFSQLKPSIDKLFARSSIYYPVSALAVAAFVLLRTRISSFLLCELYYALFTAVLVLLTMRISLCNRIIKWLGDHVFSIYILQRLPMKVLKLCGVENRYIMFFGSLCATLLLAWAFDAFLKKLDSVLFPTKPAAAGGARQPAISLDN